jgi:mono/diheme cytochrome c family protein
MSHLPGLALTMVVIGIGVPVLRHLPDPAARLPQAVTERATQMREHFERAMVLHEAIIRGDVPAVKAAAQPLTEYVGPASGAGPTNVHVAGIRDAARAAATASDMVGAAYATATMLSHCGSCHRAAGVLPAATLRGPSSLGGVVGHMLAHQQAADQLLQGLAVPSDSLWRAGAKALASAPLHARDLPVDAATRRELMGNEERIHRLATGAAEATDAKARASYYAQFLAGCAECHKRHATLWGPKK